MRPRRAPLALSLRVCIASSALPDRGLQRHSCLPPAPVSQRSVLENLVLHAHSLWRGKDYDKAIEAFDVARFAHVQWGQHMASTAYTEFGLALEHTYSEANIAKACAVLEEGLEHYPRDHHLHYNLGVMYLHRDAARMPDAIRHFQAVLRARPLHGEALNNIAFTLLHMGRHEARDVSSLVFPDERR